MMAMNYQPATLELPVAERGCGLLAERLCSSWHLALVIQCAVDPMLMLIQPGDCLADFGKSMDEFPWENMMIEG